MKLDEVYQHILKEVELGHRGLVKLSNDELQELKGLLLSTDEGLLEKVLCVVEHSATLAPEFEENILKVLNTPHSSPITIFALNCARKHIVEARFQRGNRLDFSLLDTLNKLLFHRDPEVVEWTLRLIEGCGNQGVYFLKDFDKIKPPPWKWFNAHQRSVREIITLLERRWGKFEKSRL